MLQFELSSSTTPDLSIEMNSANALLLAIREYVRLKVVRYTDLLFLNPTYPTALLSRLRILVLFNGLRIRIKGL